ncbi:OmpA family protein [Candidatus Accumulibacter vicinus]|uniref:Outer membrane protein-associated (Lipo)protein n=1 Tax=Candidatus Accumulibacter vicinus TaxID=2954382 RepID=A0A084XYR9_9PROT|nr:OmpA family protein [Candidatus Accumulibacter vicinus]KFB67613.1 MAG: Outer membrane protein-associated (lipo)protein [Candidatus Accumulibacter vicinus]
MPFRPRFLVSACLAVGVLATACSSTEEKPTVAAPGPASQVVALPYEQAVRKAAQDLLANANLAKDQKYSMVVDPLVDGNSGMQTEATVAMEQSVVQLVKENYQQVDVKPFNNETVATLPLLMIGTFTPINLQGKSDGERDAYRICFALADLKTGKIISKGLARSLPEGFDPTPLPFFREMPVWAKDTAVDGYVKTCQGTKAGDPINPAYIDAVLAASTISEATKAYQAKKYKDSLALYQSVLTNPAGNQARVYAGIYLDNQKLGRTKPAMQAFGQLVQMGLASDRLAVRFDFKPGATAFSQEQQPYSLWLSEIAKQSLRQSSCIEVAGHTRRGTSEQMDERLSLQRAEFVRQKLVAANPALAKRSMAKGYGSQRAIVGTGKGNESDALDQRIEFKKVSC